MQFHLNGFRPGDPRIHEPAPSSPAGASADEPPDEVDVLIVGCGPAGLTLAAQLSAFPDVVTRIVDVKPGPLAVGQADGIACRSMEMFEAFGFSERLVREGYRVEETVFWTPEPERPERIQRTGRVRDVEEDLSEFPHLIINQARVHDFYLELMARSSARLAPHYSRRLRHLAVDADAAATHPVSVTLERAGGAREGEPRTIRARHVVGCDGARSAVRGAIGRTLEGESANAVWGVMDVLAVTDFPDIRLKSLIRSARDGSIVVIPREGGYLVRLYVEMDALGAGERASSRGITVDDVVAAANRILHPYTLDVKEIPWWSVYEIGQRLCDRFDDVPADEADARTPRVFIAGDACHTHSPKAGQGMNVSMADAFNLGWKLAAVVSGRASPALLRTYDAERRAVARELIEFDRDWAGAVGAKSARSGAAASAATDAADDPATALRRRFVASGRYTAGTAVRYAPSIIRAESTHQGLATGFRTGERFHSAPVRRLADARPMHLGHVLKADGRWRLIAFAADGDGGGTEGPGGSGSLGSASGIRALCDRLADDPASPVRRYTPEGADVDAVIDVRAVFRRDHRELDIADMPALLLPRKGRYGLIDYEKIFCASPDDDEDVYRMRGVDAARGCLVVVRPDQYVAHVLPLDARAELAGFFDAFLLPPAR